MKFKRSFVLGMALIVIAAAAYLQYQRSHGNLPPVTAQVVVNATDVS